MTNPDIPTCWCCGHQLDRIDHAAVEHLILDGDVFRTVNVNDPLPGQAFGLGSEVQLRCGHCGAAVPVQYRKFFYQRWDAVLEVTRAIEKKE